MNKNILHPTDISALAAICAIVENAQRTQRMISQDGIKIIQKNAAQIEKRILSMTTFADHHPETDPAQHCYDVAEILQNALNAVIAGNWPF